jgi:hypothetical protein
VRLIVAALTGLLLAGCAGLLPRPTGDAETAGVSISNGTTLEVTLIINGTPVGRVAAGDGAEVPRNELPGLPWNVEARSPSGRLLVQMTVHQGDVDVEGDSQSGTGGRVDLSCGRLDLWSGPPMSGPAPGPGVPGDCLP